MKFLFLILILSGCATSDEVKKLRSDIQMLNSLNQRLLESKERTLGYSPKPLPIVMPPSPIVPQVVYVFTNSQSRMQADPEWLKTIKGTDYWADRESVRRMNNRNEGLEMILRGAHIVEQNR